MLNLIQDMVAGQGLCVLATVSEDRPHCSLMAYALDASCREIYMATLRGTQKYENLQKNPRVSLLIDERERFPGRELPRGRALTVSGRYRGFDGPEEEATARERLLARHPGLQGFLSRPDAALLRVEIEAFLLLDGLTDAHRETLPPRPSEP